MSWNGGVLDADGDESGSLPFSGDSAYFLDLYAHYRRDPVSVPSDWRLHFEAMDVGETPKVGALDASACEIVAAYRARGQLEAVLDPLGLAPRPYVAPLQRARRFAYANAATEASCRLAGREEPRQLADIIRLLECAYCGPATLGAAHVKDETAQEWIAAAFEAAVLDAQGADDSEAATAAVALADAFDALVNAKMPTKKRFGSEGSDGSVVILDELLRLAAASDKSEIVVGGIHRGRLATLATVLGAPRCPARRNQGARLDRRWTALSGRHFLSSGTRCRPRYRRGVNAGLDRAASARPERILQLCAGGNMIVANLSTPANLFHLLSRKMHAPSCKPLAVIAPKSLLRLKAAISARRDFTGGTRFETVIGDGLADASTVDRVIICSRKVWDDLAAFAEVAGIRHRVALIRMEQLYPFDGEALLSALGSLKVGSELIWCQEEPENQGAWLHVRESLSRASRELASRLRYVGRGALPVAAGGSIERHEIEQRALVADALGVTRIGVR